MILILLIIFLNCTSQESSNTKEELDNDLLKAIENGQTEKVLDLIKAGADVNAKSNNGETARMLASAHGHMVTTKSLLGFHADVNA